MTKLITLLDGINKAARERAVWASLNEEEVRQFTYLLRLQNLAVKENKSDAYVLEKLVKQGIDLEVAAYRVNYSVNSKNILEDQTEGNVKERPFDKSIFVPVILLIILILIFRIF